ncbi:MAG: AAC(3) family N-acetyltransferase [Anaerolineae bacterium]|nr:AAC(3) family N-acetyltransferase [Anaerolineae bacterium]
MARVEHLHRRPIVTQERIAADLRKLGLGAGDRVFFHSSLRSIGYVEGGAEAVVRAFQEVFGPTGTVMVPTFAWEYRRFEVLRTPSQVGRITEVFRRQPGVLRSWHPTHSVSVWGADAAELIEGHHLMPGLGPDSPPARLAGLGGYVLLLGVGHNRNSTIHVGEACANVPYWGRTWPVPKDPVVVVLPGGEIIDVPLLHPPGCSAGFDAVGPVLEARGVVRKGFVGAAPVQLMRGQDLIDVVVDMLRENPAALLCSNPACASCRRAREILAART